SLLQNSNNGRDDFHVVPISGSHENNEIKQIKQKYWGRRGSRPYQVGILQAKPPGWPRRGTACGLVRSLVTVWLGFWRRRVGAFGLCLLSLDISCQAIFQIDVHFIGHRLKVQARFVESFGMELDSSQMDVNALALDFIVGQA